MSRISGILLLAFSITCVFSARAGDDDVGVRREQARTIALAGFELFNDGQYQAAIVKLEEAERIFHAPTHLLYIARARRELGELIAAHDTYVDILVDPLPDFAPPQFHEARQEAAAEAQALRARIATIRIRIARAPPDAVTVTLDGRPIPRAEWDHPVAITPGTHIIRATTETLKEASQTITGIVGETQAVTLELVPAGPLTTPVPAETGARIPKPAGPAPDALADHNAEVAVFRGLGWTFTMIGVTVLGAGIGFTVWNEGRIDDLRDEFEPALEAGGQCDTSAFDYELREQYCVDLAQDVDAAKEARLGTGLHFGLGGAFLITGVVLLIAGPDDDDYLRGAEVDVPRLKPFFGPTLAGVYGEF